MSYHWPQSDNQKYRGKIDRIFVSLTEGWEVDYYVDHYLKSRGYSQTDASRAVIHQQMELYPGRAPILRTDMDTWLDNRVSAKR